MPVTYKKIASVTVGSGGAANIILSSIPATYDDLALHVSARSTRTPSVVDSVIPYFNTDTASLTNYTMRTAYAAGSGTPVSDTIKRGGLISTNGATTSTFGSIFFYIPNYRVNANKSVSIDGVSENNATEAYTGLTAMVWASTEAITTITLVMEASGSNFVQHSTATLYGISKS